MKSTHNTIRALAIGLVLTLLLVTGTAAMMAAFSTTPPATDIYRRVALTPLSEPATYMATGHDSVLYERVVLADGRVQWVLIDEPGVSVATLARGQAGVDVANNNTPSIYSGAARTVSYTLVVKPAGLSKPLKNCNRSAYGAYDIACTTLS
ncbi:MAG: hypothetical protein C0428_00810 [Polaromonas sp.]|nr:hypothetical protein [Polaromonas sp.]